MSLAWHLRNNLDSDIGDFLQRRFSHTKRLTLYVNQKLQQANMLLPYSSYSPFRTLDRALHYRISYSFDLIPSQELPAWRGAFERLVQFRDEEFVGGPYSSDVLISFFERLDATLNTLQPVGCSLNAESEQILARYCFVLALFEEALRDNSYRYSPLIMPRAKRSVDELLAIPQEEWIDDLCDMFALFHAQCAYMLSLPHILHPRFMGERHVWVTDTDLIIDGSLIEIKANIERSIQPSWLRQLVGCVLLDYEDQYHIQSVGIYMARHGRLVSWPLNRFLEGLSGKSTIDLASLRQEFRTCCENLPVPW
jgi:hypothetical protein